MKREHRVIGQFVNGTIVSFDNGKVVVIDTLAEEDQARELVELAKKAGSVAYVINTHEHADHLAGNRFFDCPTICSSEAFQETRLGSLMGSRLGSDPTCGTSITFDHRMTLYLEEPVELIHMGGHCPGAIVVYLPERKLLFSGDLVFNGRMPYMGDADLGLWISVLKTLEQWDIDQVVPGHGPQGSRQILTEQSHWLEWFIAQVKEWKMDGLEDEIVFAKAVKAFNPPDEWHGMLKKAIRLALTE